VSPWRAHRLGARGTCPVSFVALDAVDEPTAVLPEVAASIGLGLDSGLSALDALTAAFADRPFLLVVDNFEQVQAAAPDFAKLLVGCPKVSVPATSRVPLKVRGERLVPLGPLELPASDDRIASEQSAAVRLSSTGPGPYGQPSPSRIRGIGMRWCSYADDWTESRSRSS
jgi:predicted ATPase